MVTYLYLLFVLCQLASAAEKPVPVFDERGIDLGLDGGQEELVDTEFMRLWQHDTEEAKGQRDVNVVSSKDVKTIVTAGITASLRMDVGNPFYDAENSELRAEILNDAFVTERIDPNDARMETAEGLTVENLQGNKLNFKRSNGVLTVNGVLASASPEEGADGRVVYTLVENLFGYRQKLERAYANSPAQSGPFNYQGPPF